MTDTSQARYSTGAIIFHWIIAIAVIVNWRLVEAAEGLEGMEKVVALNPHKALGITILVLSVLRLGWRFTHKAPPLSESLASWERILARSVHVIFYVLLIGLPLGGWLATSYAHIPIDYFGLFTVPNFPVEQNYDTAGSIVDLHHEGGEILLILIALHIVGALKHSFYDKVPSLSRMWFGRG